MQNRSEPGSCSFPNNAVDTVGGWVEAILGVL